MPAMTNRLQLLLDDARRERLEAESGRTGAPVSELIRRAIDVVYGGDLAAEAAPAGSWASASAGELPDDLREVIVAEAARRGTNPEEVLRRAVTDSLGRPPRRPGILDAEPFAERVDELLDGFGSR
jgi:hypothetical protein